jgi:hypothetical protein
MISSAKRGISKMLILHCRSSCNQRKQILITQKIYQLPPRVILYHFRTYSRNVKQFLIRNNAVGNDQRVRRNDRNIHLQSSQLDQINFLLYQIQASAEGRMNPRMRSLPGTLLKHFCKIHGGVCWRIFAYLLGLEVMRKPN